MYILILIIVVFLVLILISTRNFKLRVEIHADPARDYQDALARIKDIQAAESELVDLNSMCGTGLLTHGGRAENVIVFLHGFTSCPDQFRQLGEEYFQLGYNVFIPRLPRHGIKDKLGNPLKGLNAEELAQFASQAVDIAQGLGDRVIVAGLSGGGSMTTWLSQVRDDVDLAVPIAPFLGIGFIPGFLNRPLTNLMLLVPDFFQWWDPINKENNPRSMPYSYTRYPTRALFENLRLGYIAEASARKNKPAAASILVVTNANDTSVNNAVIAEFVKLWSRYGEGFARDFQFDKELEIPHDMITAGRPDSKTELVYPKLHELIY
jgi:pimeloyl-ACP methyl ester carboxylesterase